MVVRREGRQQRQRRESTRDVQEPAVHLEAGAEGSLQVKLGRKKLESVQRHREQGWSLDFIPDADGLEGWELGYKPKPGICLGKGHLVTILKLGGKRGQDGEEEEQEEQL